MWKGRARWSAAARGGGPGKPAQGGLRVMDTKVNHPAGQTVAHRAAEAQRPAAPVDAKAAAPEKVDTVQAVPAVDTAPERTEEARVGKEGGSTCSTWWSTDHSKKNKQPTHQNQLKQQ